MRRNPGLPLFLAITSCGGGVSAGPGDGGVVASDSGASSLSDADAASPPPCVARTLATQPGGTIGGLAAGPPDLVAFAGSTFYRSEDDGASWSALAALPTGDSADFVADATAVYAVDYGATTSRLLRIARADATVTTLGTGIDGPLAQDGDNLYSAPYAQGVVRIPKAGGAATTVVQGTFDRVFAAGGHLYWSQFTDTSESFWWSALDPVVGSPLGTVTLPPSCAPPTFGAWGAWQSEVVFVADPYMATPGPGCEPPAWIGSLSGALPTGADGGPYAFLVDGPNAYYIDGFGNLSRYSMDTRANVALVPNAYSAFAFATDASCFYYADGSGIHALQK
jgi:hypothetical protein